MRSKIKRLFKVCAIALLGFTVVAAPFIWWNWDSIRHGVLEEIDNYRKTKLVESISTCVKDLPQTDKVVIMRLTDEPVNVGQPKFATAVWGGDLYLAKEVLLSGVAAESFSSLWRKQDVCPNGVNCHNPHHAIRFYANGRLLCETIICLRCSNASLPVGFSRDLAEFDTYKPEYIKLKSEIERLVGASD